MNEDLEHIAAAELGEAARAFVESDLGKVVIGMARQDAEMAKNALLTIDPKDTMKISELQKEAAFGNRFEQYLAELITRGNEALAVLSETT